MSNFVDFVEFFSHLDTITALNVASWLGQKDQKLIENKFGNRLLYPQTVPVSAEDLQFDLAILREEIKLQPQKYYSQIFRKITIPDKFLTRFPDLQKLIWAFIDAIKPSGITTLLLKSADLTTKNLGTVLRPEEIQPEGSISLVVDDKKYQIKNGSLIVIPTRGQKVDLKFNSSSACLLGQRNLTSEVVGGVGGLTVDARI